MKSLRLLLTLLIIFPGWVLAVDYLPGMVECSYNDFRVIAIPDHCTFRSDERDSITPPNLRFLCVGSIQCEAYKRGFGRGPTFHFPSIMCKADNYHRDYGCHGCFGCPSAKDCLSGILDIPDEYKLRVKDKKIYRRYYRKKREYGTVPAIVEE